MYLAARLRERIGAPGLDVAGTIPFRDKESMKEVLRAAGIRVPRSVRASTIADVHAGAEEVGYPLIIKPISGAGSMDTYRIDEPAGLEPVLPALRAVPEVSVEEFVDGEEFTFDSISTGGRVGLLQRVLVPAAPTRDEAARVGQPADHRPARARRRAAGGRRRDGP